MSTKAHPQKADSSPRSHLQRKGLRVALMLALGAALTAALIPLAASRYDVAATTPHAPLVERFLRKSMERSVSFHASSVVIPPEVDLRDPELAATAIGHYSVACVGCHSAPGAKADPWMVLYPPPADLTKKEVVDRLSDREIYWIVKHGIKDTGMIALGPTHQERDIWAVSAFVRQLPEMRPQRYAQLVEEFQKDQLSKQAPTHEHHEHVHHPTM